MNVIVTGSSRGIGEAIALEFAKSGYNVVINSRNDHDLKETKDAILRNVNDSVKIIHFPGDVSLAIVRLNEYDEN